MKKIDEDLQKIVMLAELFYGNLENPKILDGGITRYYSNFECMPIKEMLEKIFQYVDNETDLNDDRCIVFRVSNKIKSGFVFFSFIDKYVYLHNFFELAKDLEQAGFSVVDYETASKEVVANVDFFSYEDKVQVFNILFSNYALDSLA